VKPFTRVMYLDSSLNKDALPAFQNHSFLHLHKVVRTRAKGPNELELNPVSVAWSNWEYCYSPLDGILVHRRITPSSTLPVPIYTPGWRETMWDKVSCLRKQHDGRHWASNHQPLDLKSHTLTTTSPRPHLHLRKGINPEADMQNWKLLTVVIRQCYCGQKLFTKLQAVSLSSQGYLRKMSK